MKIIRYSKHGFKPQYQSHHLQTQVDYHLNDFNISVYPEHLKPYILDSHNKLVSFYQKHYNSLKYGVWAFIDGHKNNQSLNHLKERVPCWSAEIDECVTVVGVNWDEILPISDPKCIPFGFFLPLESMSLIKDIKRIG